ncbi:hypothetical protein [Bathymodiolus japonicus methanotrophic gill symbiont]|nr:hypothetical protein [Bathymodiolus japonicus methanotrophic gill symbiont]
MAKKLKLVMCVEIGEEVVTSAALVEMHFYHEEHEGLEELIL